MRSFFSHAALAVTLAAPFAFAAPALTAADFAIDNSHAAANFAVSHMDLSDTHGRFNVISGDISFDESKPEAAKITVNIDPASIDTANADRDKHLKNADFWMSVCTKSFLLCRLLGRKRMMPRYSMSPVR